MREVRWGDLKYQEGYGWMIVYNERKVGLDGLSTPVGSRSLKIWRLFKYHRMTTKSRTKKDSNKLEDEKKITKDTHDIWRPNKKTIEHAYELLMATENKDYRLYESDDWLCEKWKDTPVFRFHSYAAAHARVAAIKEEYKVLRKHKFVIHDTRRVSAIDAQLNGTGIKQSQKHLNHASTAMTETYLDGVVGKGYNLGEVDFDKY